MHFNGEVVLSIVADASTVEFVAIGPHEKYARVPGTTAAYKE